MTPSYLDTIVDCVLSSYSVDSEIICNLIQIARAAFDHGADCQRSLVANFYDTKSDSYVFEVPCAQSVWAFLIWRTICTTGIYLLESESTTLTQFLEYC